jgi:hypothetical protein
VACQREKDVLFTLSIALPIMLAAAAFFLFGRKDENEVIPSYIASRVVYTRPSASPGTEEPGDYLPISGLHRNSFNDF